MKDKSNITNSIQCGGGGIMPPIGFLMLSQNGLQLEDETFRSFVSAGCPRKSFPLFENEITLKVWDQKVQLRCFWIAEMYTVKPLYSGHPL